MKGRGGGGGGSGAGPTDLLVCFPSRAHLALMPKPICSPSRPTTTEPGKRHLRLHHPARPTAASRGHPSPSPLFAKPPAASAKHARSPGADDEPTSPKVTCAGQIKVGRPKPTPRARPRPTKSRLSVVDEVERPRADRTAAGGRERKPTWLEAIGLRKKDAWQFLSALRGVHFNLGCFGSFRGAVECSTDEEDDGGEEEEEEEEEDEDDDEAVEVGEKHGDGDGESRSGTRTIFSKWFMVLEQNQALGFNKEGQEEEVDEEDEKEDNEDGRGLGPSSVPPPNALLLMRCRSAPAKGLLSRQREEETGDDAQADHKEEEEEQQQDDDDDEEEEEERAIKMIEEEEKEKERLVLMSYAPDFFKVSMDIAKETWVVGSADPFARSRSWKR